jgi:gamma-glutamyltranspeptidase/glutathione hydrolase
MSGAIATPHILATRAGKEAFDAGGNAIDAALAAAATLTVVFPHQCALGGDLFALINRPDGKTFSVNGSGALPAAVDAEEYRSRFSQIPESGPYSITVPGLLCAWERIAELGGILNFSEIFSPAIRAAADGVKVSPSLAAGIQWRRKILLQDKGMAELFLPKGKPLIEGTLFVQPALQVTLETIAAEGVSSFYKGSVGEKLVSALQSQGSPLTMDDLAAHQTEINDPLSFDYGDLSILTSPPNSQGFVLLESIAGLAELGIELGASINSAPYKLHAAMMAAEDRDRYLGDPNHVSVPLSTLLDKALLGERLRQRLHQNRSEFGKYHYSRANGDTVAICTMDSDGMAVSLIQSVYQTFGAGILDSETGIIMHNRARGFSLTRGAPNELIPGTRPAHTLMPVLVCRDGNPIASLGTMGGKAQPQILLQILAGALDLTTSIAHTLAAPRWVFGSMDMGFDYPTIAIEDDAVSELSELLQTDGFEIARVEPQNEIMGHSNVVRLHEDGKFEASADPRSDGLALIHEC